VLLLLLLQKSPPSLLLQHTLSPLISLLLLLLLLMLLLTWLPNTPTLLPPRSCLLLPPIDRFYCLSLLSNLFLGLS